MLTYGIREQTVISDELDFHVEEIRCKGFTVLTGVFSADDMANARQAIDRVYSAQVAEMGGKDSLGKVKDEDIVRCPLASDDISFQIATNKRIHELIERVLGGAYVLLMQNGIINRPQREQYQVRWHRDLNYQHWTSSRTLALSFLVCVDDFFKEGGATWVLPGSHLYEKFPSDRFVENHEIVVEASAGSVVVMDCMTFHRAGANSTQDFTRRAVNHVIGSPFMSQQIDLPNILAEQGKDYSQDPFLSMYLGYRWNPAASPKAWRERHLVK